MYLGWADKAVFNKDGTFCIENQSDGSILLSILEDDLD